MLLPAALPLITAAIVDSPPAGVTRNPARQFARHTLPLYSPPQIPFDAPLKLKSPCCSTSAPPSSISSTNRTSVCPSTPVPPATCSLPPLTEITAAGSVSDQYVSRSAGWLYSSSTSVEVPRVS